LRRRRWISIRPLRGLLDQHELRSACSREWTRTGPCICAGPRSASARAPPPCWSSSPGGAYRDPVAIAGRGPEPCAGVGGSQYARCAGYSISMIGARCAGCSTGGAARSDAQRASRQKQSPFRVHSGARARVSGLVPGPAGVPDPVPRPLARRDQARRVAPEGRIETRSPSQGRGPEPCVGVGGSRYARCAGCSISMKGARCAGCSISMKGARCAGCSISMVGPAARVVSGRRPPGRSG